MNKIVIRSLETLHTSFLYIPPALPCDGVPGADLGHVVKVLAVSFVTKVLDSLPSSDGGKRQDLLS